MPRVRNAQMAIYLSLSLNSIMKLSLFFLCCCVVNREAELFPYFEKGYYVGLYLFCNCTSKFISADHFSCDFWMY